MVYAFFQLPTPDSQVIDPPDDEALLADLTYTQFTCYMVIVIASLSLGLSNSAPNTHELGMPVIITPYVVVPHKKPPRSRQAATKHWIVTVRGPSQASRVQDKILIA